MSHHDLRTGEEMKIVLPKHTSQRDRVFLRIGSADFIEKGGRSGGYDAWNARLFILTDKAAELEIKSRGDFDRVYPLPDSQRRIVGLSEVMRDGGEVLIPPGARVHLAAVSEQHWCDIHRGGGFSASIIVLAGRLYGVGSPFDREAPIDAAVLDALVRNRADGVTVHEFKAVPVQSRSARFDQDLSAFWEAKRRVEAYFPAVIEDLMKGRDVVAFEEPVSFTLGNKTYETTEIRRQPPTGVRADESAEFWLKDAKGGTIPIPYMRDEGDSSHVGGLPAVLWIRFAEELVCEMKNGIARAESAGEFVAESDGESRGKKEGVTP